LGDILVPNISILIPTYNRSQELAATLDGMVDTDKSNLSVEVVVIDNGSTDQTRFIVEAFSNRLRVRYLYEERPGKSSALNAALEKVELGDIVVFTDDDVDPSREWLVSIASICDRWGDYSVFGGRIKVRFPMMNVPNWALKSDIADFAFSWHDYSADESVYEGRKTPFGPNFWVKKRVFGNGRRFDEKIGAFPGYMIMGEDTLFLMELLDDGYRIVYSPSAVVTHRVRPSVLKISAIYRRAYRLGRGEAHYYSLPTQRRLTWLWPNLKQNETAWWVYRSAAVMLYALQVIWAFIFSRKEERLVNVVKRLRGLGYRVEAVRLLQSGVR
jgi:glycosyltransferase involved in cell wall biosynthesis